MRSYRISVSFLLIIFILSIISRTGDNQSLAYYDQYQAPYLFIQLHSNNLLSLDSHSVDDLMSLLGGLQEELTELDKIIKELLSVFKTECGANQGGNEDFCNQLMKELEELMKRRGGIDTQVSIVQNTLNERTEANST